MNSNNIGINFFGKLRDKRSVSVLGDVYKFINNEFSEKLNNATNDIFSLSMLIQDFISKVCSDFAKVWNIEFTDDKSYYIEICDGFESLIVKSLYSRIISLYKDDSRFDLCVKKYVFITVNLLGIEVELDEFDLFPQIKSKFHI